MVEIIDKKDMKLIHALEKNSRRSISNIAKEMGVSKEVANYRLKRLHNRNIVRGYKLVVNNFALGYKSYFLLINLHNLTPTVRTNMIKDIRLNPNMKCTKFLQSEYDIGLFFWIKKKDHLKELEKILSKYAIYIQKKRLVLITEIRHLSLSHIHHYKKLEVSYGISAYQKLTDKEKLLIMELSKDPLQKITELCSKLEISAQVASKIIRHLYHKNILMGIFPIIDNENLNYNKYKIFIEMANFEKKKQLISHLSLHPHVSKIYDTLGFCDVMFNVQFQHTLELDKFLTKLRTNFPDIIDFNVGMIIE